MAGGGAKETRTVYSTATGDLRKTEGSPVQEAGSAGNAANAPVKVSLDTKGRRGKTVTVVSGIQHNPQVLEDLTRTLKSLCGAGGTLEGRQILIQGDHRDKVVSKLIALGYKAKRI